MADTNDTVDFSKLSADLYRNWERAMAGWWDQVLESPSFLGAMGQNLAAQAQARAVYERSVDEQMERMHLPTRKDLVRVARIATLLEERLLAQEDLLLQLKDQLTAAERAALTARIDAAEARLELRDAVTALRADVASLREAVAAPAITAPSAPVPDAAASRTSRRGGRS
jgi:hypothetical protein